MNLLCWLLVASASLYRGFRLQIDAPPTKSYLDAAKGPGYEYDLETLDEWGEANFERKWEMFRDAVPIAKFQANFDPDLDYCPVCRPSLVGPTNSNKLAILTHGFLACPGLWFRVVPLLIDRGFRVMLPTLPGHGRAWLFPDSGVRQNISTLVMDPEEGPSTNASNMPTDLSDAQDDIDDIPTNDAAYKIFAKTLGQLAVQFKKEHPDGIVVAAGHSLGGAVTARYALDIPYAVDRVMLLNPMLGLASSWAQMMTYLTPNMLLSKGSKCERDRGKGSGGQCQFRLSHVSAMSQFASSLLCEHWGITRAARCGTHRREFGRMKGFQVVTTHGENSVDNAIIERFVREVQMERRARGLNVEFSALCKWPKDLGHSYLSNRKLEASASADKWWHPYVETSLVNFLSQGKLVEVVRTGSANECLLSSANVEGANLVLLPAVQHRDRYVIGSPGGDAQSLPAYVMYSGYMDKESHTWGAMKLRHIEILFYGRRVLLVTRKFENENIRNIYAIRDKDLVEIVLMAGSICMIPRVDDVEVDIGLDEALAKANILRHRGSSPRELHFCGIGSVKLVCQKLECAIKRDEKHGDVVKALETLGPDVMKLFL